MKHEERIADFKAASTLAKAIQVVKGFGAYHQTYCIYTTLDIVEKTLCAITPRLWLTRIDSGLFDDGIEAVKYGTKEERERTYIRSFMYGAQESAGMWGLYSPPTYKAVRIEISKAGIESLKAAKVFKAKGGKNLSAKCAVRSTTLSDLIYAAVEDEDSPKRRSQNLFWSGAFTGIIKNLSTSKDWKSATGFVKDVEWRFENEFRLVVKTKKNEGDHVAIELPQEFINSMKFTLSPWANADEKRFVRGLLSGWLGKAGRDIASDDKKVFKDSVLSKGLQQWAQRRGL